MQGLAICVRGSVARPLHGSMTSMKETVPSIFDRYTDTRGKSAVARQEALRVRTKYVKALRDAEAAIRDLLQEQSNQDTAVKQEGESTSSSDAVATASLNPWERSLRAFGQNHNVSPERLIAYLNEVRALEETYKTLVAKENQAVSLSQTMEMMALEAVQKLEEVRRTMRIYCS